MYLIIDERGDALLVDPSMGEMQALALLRDEGLHLLAILNTHGHNDHVFGNAAVKEATRARLAIHRADAYRLDARTRPSVSPETRAMFGGRLDAVPPATVDDLIEEGPLTYLRDLELVALHTPGHTEGSTCFYLPQEKTLFSGDLLFRGNIGRTDLRGGDPNAMERSLERAAALPPDTTVYPGHGAPTTIGAERVTLAELRDAGYLPGLRL
ncbi:MAG: MBL fold metallo-hydrolase [Chloroflexi bacterium]|nr:MBL fold metallo-hydrolase [Chloroflexota bacterium]